MREERKTSRLEETGSKEAETYIRYLKGLLHYHECVIVEPPVDRTTGEELPCKPIGELYRCPRAAFTDEYAEALREAIRCMEAVYGQGSTM